MALLDKLLKRKDESSTETGGALEPASAMVLSGKNSIEQAIAERTDGLTLDQCLKIPLTDIAALSTSFAQMLPAFRTVTAKGDFGYMPTNMGKGLSLKQAKDGTYWGSFLNGDKKSVMTKFEKVGSVGMQIPIDPSTVMIAAMLVEINRKLDDIKAVQAKILSFLEEDKRAEQQGNLNVLDDMAKAYFYNWDNDQFRQNHHMKALDIRQSAEKNLVFYQGQIASEIRTLPTISLDQNIRNAAGRLQTLFQDYRTALHVFGYSSLLEVLLLGNFDEGYLNQVAEKISSYDEQYQSQRKQCHELVQKLSASSVESQIAKGVGTAGKALGKLLSSASVLRKGSVDEWLRDGSEKIMKLGDSRAEKTIAILGDDVDSGVEIFVDGVRNVETISNHTVGMFFDENIVYLAVG